ncbi:Plasmodium exported protein, unknown function [Plasmodium vivax]|uniref:Variable surface protein Vir35 n=1 Tax=Plasmodium vivax TaxID=5855 RepID=A0A565A031_PLAVI|nr:Plasmodium exported protein, unknown function [Plasmodium vivax]
MITMAIIKNIHIKENIRFGVFLNIFMIIFSMWIYFPHDDFTLGRTKKNVNNKGSSLNICIKRYLVEYEGEAKIGKTVLYKNSPYYFENKVTRNYDDNVSIYGNIKNSDSKKLKLYKNAYKHRYAKKKGLSKLDCYYENKIFKKIDNIYNLADKMGNDKKGFKKKILKKYGIGFIILTLIPALGLIYYILFGLDKDLRGAIELCRDTGHYTGETHQNNGCAALDTKLWKSTLINIEISNFIFIFITITIILLFFIYILTKVIKYEKLKAGKGKNCLKEYYNFCKDLIRKT